MATFKILSADGSLARYEGCPKYVGTYLKPSYIEFSEVCSPAPIEWEVGDYVDYYRTGLRYKLYSIPQATKKARMFSNGSAFIYNNVQLFAATKDLEIALFRDLVANDNGIHFSTSSDVSTFEDVAGVARRIQACMDDVFPGRWEIRVASVDDADLAAMMQETKEFSVNNGSCLSALEQVYQTWKNVGWTHTYDASSGKDIITIGASSIRTDANTTEVFAYGRRKGLSSIRKADANKDGFATRLYVYGSERNIQTRYYNGLDIYNAESVDIRHLMIPPEHWGKTDGKPDARKAYLQADDAIVAKYGLIPRTIYFDGGENEEIYPSIRGIKASELRALMIASGLGDSEYLPDDSESRIDKVVGASGWGDGSKEDAELVPTFSMTIQQVGFNIAEQGKQTAEGYASISFLSGGCAGRDFKVKSFTYDRNGRPTLLLEKFWDDSIGIAFPNDMNPVSEGDEFVILDIPMPDYYITLAQNKLYAKAQQMLADYTKVSAFYEPEIDPIMVKEKDAVLKEGMYMQVMDEDVVENNTDYVLIDTINIDENGVLPTYKVTLREQKRSVTTFSSLQEMITDAKYESKADIRKERQYVERRFRTAQETLDMLQGAIGDFSAAINPITLQTMAILVGSQSLQFTFIKSLSNTTKVTPAFAYDSATKIFSVPKSVVMHYTIGQNEITSSHSTDSLRKWEVKAFQSSALLEDSKAYYLYASVPNSGTGSFALSDTPMDFQTSAGYNLLVGILNSAETGSRSFAPLYGFTEVLPGQITTDVIRSADGKTYFDLAQGKIGGRIVFTSNNTEKELANWAGNTDAALAGKANTSALEDLEESLENQLSSLQADLEAQIKDFQDQIDGVIETWFYDPEPTLDNAPAKDWTTEDEKANHIGDLYYSGSGKSYRWLKDASGNYLWKQIADEDIGKALEAAQKAQDTADNKRRVFTSTPSAPYDKGDLWTDETDLRVCTSSRTSGYSSSDWKLATDYTNDAKAQQALAGLAEAIKDIEKAQTDAINASEAAANAAAVAANAQSAAEEASQKAKDAEDAASAAKDMMDSWLEDGVFSKTELASLKAERARVQAEYNEVSTSATNYGINAATYRTAYGYYNTELNKVITALGSDDTTKSANLATYQGDYYNALKPLLAEIAAAAKAVADDAAEEAEKAKQEAEEAKNKAEAAQTAAQMAAAAANAVTEKIDSDNYLTEIEKQSVRKTIAEITECQGTLLTDTAVISLTQPANPWTKIKKGDTTPVLSSTEGMRTVSRDKYVGYYGSNFHNAGSSIVKLKIEKKKDFTLKLKFLSDSYKITDSYGAAGALGVSMTSSTAVYSSSNHGTAQNKITYARPYASGTEISKEYSVTSANTSVDVSYYKVNSVGMDTVPYTDSTYFKFANDHYTSSDGKEHIVELNGSFHRYYLLLMQLGYDAIATELANKLQSIFRILEEADVWTTGTTELADGYLFRADLNAALTDYYAILAACGWDVMDSKVHDLDYLTNALKNGSTVTEGGLIMTSLVAVGDTEDLNKTEVEAFLNGSDFAKDSEHGKLLLAGGIPSTVTENGTEYSDLDKRAKAAATKIYEDGYMRTRLLELLDGCKIGNIEIINGGFKITLNDGGSGSNLSLWSGGLLSSAIGGTASLGASSSAAIQAYSKSAQQSSPSGVNAAVIAEGTTSEYAFYSREGKFAGLRPNVQTIGSGSTLNETQHTLIIASGTLYLPNAPKDGQEYKIIHTSTTSLQVRNTLTSNLNVFDFKNATSKSYTVTSNAKETIELVYNAADSTWYANKY